jgi:rhodanese-related sulfurtransferase
VSVQLDITLEAALRAGHELEQEQQHVMDNNLAREYMTGGWGDSLGVEERRAMRGRWGSRRRKEQPPPPQQQQPQPLVQDAASEAYWRLMRQEAVTAPSQELQQQQGEEGEAVASVVEQQQQQEEAAAAEYPARPWPVMGPEELHAAMASRSVVVLDVRSEWDWDWGKIKGAVHCPVVLPNGTRLNPSTKPNPAFLAQAAAKVKSKGARVCVYSGASAKLGSGGVAKVEEGKAEGEWYLHEAVAMQAIEQLVADGWSDVCELAGGYRAWDSIFRATGQRREKGKWACTQSGDLEYWTASN